jgi:hypothetical protein
MTQMKINKMLLSTGGDYVTLGRITLDKRATAEIRHTAFLVINNKFEKFPMQAVYPEVGSNNVKIESDSKSKSIE